MALLDDLNPDNLNLDSLKNIGDSIFSIDNIGKIISDPLGSATSVIGSTTDKAQETGEAIIEQGKGLIDVGLNPFTSMFESLRDALIIGGIVIVCALIGYMIYKWLGSS